MSIEGAAIATVATSAIAVARLLGHRPQLLMIILFAHCFNEFFFVTTAVISDFIPACDHDCFLEFKTCTNEVGVCANTENVYHKTITTTTRTTATTARTTISTTTTATTITTPVLVVVSSSIVVVVIVVVTVAAVFGVSLALSGSRRHFG